MYKGAIIIQGQSNYVNELRKAWKGYDLIWSTWIGEEEKYEDADIVVYNEIPKVRGTGNLALQQKTTLNGVLKAKELNFERVLKWRSDMIPTDSNKFMKIFELNSVNMFFYHVASGGYFVDYFMEGTIKNIYDMWNFNYLNPPFAEKALTMNIRDIELNKNTVFIGDKITKENDVIWLKKKINLSSPLYQKSNSGFITTEIEYD